MKPEMCDITTDELALVEGGVEQGTYCGIAVGVTAVLGVLNPLTLFFTVEQTAAVCMADYLGR